MERFFPFFGVITDIIFTYEVWEKEKVTLAIYPIRVYNSCMK